MLNGLFRNYSDRERLPLGVQIAVIAVVLLFFGLTIEIDKTMTCKSQYSYCTVESHNFFRIKKSKRLFIPKNVDYVNIDSYEKTIRRREDMFQIIRSRIRAQSNQRSQGSLTPRREEQS